MIENFNFKSNFQQILVIIVMSIVLAFIYNSFSPRGIPVFRKAQSIQYVSNEDLYNIQHLDTILNRNVSTSQMSELIKNKKSIIIDARNKEAYNKGHIPGSINVPYLDIYNYIEFLNNIPRDTLIVVYCEGINCELSHHLAEFLKGMNFLRIFHYSEGIEEWIKNKLPLERVE